MAGMRQMPLQRLAGLAILLGSLLLPVYAVAHEAAHGDDFADHAAEQCLLCQVLSHKSAPIPPRTNPSPADVPASGVIVSQVLDARPESDLARYPVSPRGPPRV